jgi:hypothetical protein
MNGKPESVMGVTPVVKFSDLCGSNREQQLRDFPRDLDRVDLLNSRKAEVLFEREAIEEYTGEYYDLLHGRAAGVGLRL